MRICVERTSGSGLGALVPLQPPHMPAASTWRGNLLRDDPPIEDDRAGTTLLCWSGTLADDFFAAHPANWLRPGHDALAERCAALEPRLRAAGRRLCVQPHSRHVLSDVPACLSFMREHEGGPFDIALSPASLLEPPMLRDIEDHLQRIIEALGPRCAMVVLHDAITCERDPESALDPVPLGRGMLPQKLIVRLLREHVDAGVPIVISDEEVEAQRRWLE